MAAPKAGAADGGLSGRVEAPTEGIFAIAMALLVPKLKYLDPQSPAGASGLLHSPDRKGAAGCSQA